MTAPPQPGGQPHTKVDLHTHVIPEGWPDLEQRYGYPGFISLEKEDTGGARMMLNGKCFRRIESNCWCPRARLAECDRDGVDVQVLSTIPVMFSYWAKPKDALDLAQRLNDHIAELVSGHPNRFIGLGTLPMQDPELSIAELERCVGELGLRGVEIGTHVNDWNLDQPELLPVFQRAEQLGAAVFVHPWDMLGKERMPNYWLPWLVGMPAETSLAICSMIFGGVFERVPQLRVGFAHGGGAFPFNLGRIEHGFRVRPDLCATRNKTNPRDYVGRFYMDTLVHDPAALRYLIELVGVDRLALGSDYPFPLGEAHPGRLIESLPELSERDRGRLLGGSALEFLGVAGDGWGAAGIA